MIDDDALRGVLEFAHEVLRACPQDSVAALPEVLRPVARARRLDRRGATALRRALEEHDSLRAAVLEGARQVSRTGDERFSPVEWLWLERPEGWEASVRTQIELQLEQRRIDRLQLEERTAQRRLEAVEEHLSRARAETERVGRELAAERSAREQSEAQVRDGEVSSAALRQQIAQLQSELRRAKEHAHDAEERASDALLARDTEVALRSAAQERLVEAQAAFERALLSRVEAEDELLRRIETLTDTQPAVASTRPQRQAHDREPIAIPGGRYGSDVEVAEYLLSLNGVVVIVDGYNVAKTLWPDAPALALRERVIEVIETMVRRLGSRVHVVFDGRDDVVGWTATRRLVHVHFSHTGESGDDAIRRLARSLPETVPIIAVTTDRELGNSLRHLGANVISSQQFLDAVT